MQQDTTLTNHSIESKLYGHFDELQKKLVPLWRMIGRSDPGGPLEEENTIVVLPSLTVDVDLSSPIQQAYEERFMFMLLLLRQPDLRIIYLTSLPVEQNIVDYYLHVLPGVIISNARRRLNMVAPGDASRRSLAEKILARPRLIRHIQELIPDLERAHLVPFLTTDLERELAVKLGIPMYAADPRYYAFGTKSGSRQIFQEVGVPHPLGYENLHSFDELVGAIVSMRAQKPSIQKVIVKLNEGVSGMGNAQVDLSGLPGPGNADETEMVEQRLGDMRFELSSVQYDDYKVKFNQQGGIVEELVSGSEVRSPSAQLRISPLGEVEQLSTHDQILGGPGGQSYLGARFPANPEYAPQIMYYADKIGERFAENGIVGRFAVDFLVVRDQKGDWEFYAIEVNLRKGGTTHPFLTLQYLTDGVYHPETAVFTTARGQPKYYVASDHIDSPKYRAFTPDDLFDIVSRHRLHFDHTSQTGLVMHMLSSVSSAGRLGVTAIGDTPEMAEKLYAKFVAVLDDQAEKWNTPLKI